MDCFQNIVGVEACSNSVSTSGLWINGKLGLPGININNAARSVDGETISGFELLEGCVMNASSEIVLLATEHLSKYFQFNTVVQDYSSSNNGAYTTNPPNLYIQIRDECRKYTSFYIDTMTFLSTDTQTAVLTINGTNYNLSLVANTSYTMEVNLSFNADLTISIVGTNIRTLDSFFDGLIQQRCDENLFWCQYKKELAMAIRYMAAHLFFKEVELTDRFNLYTTMSKENAKSESLFNYNKSMQYLKSGIEKIKNIVSRENCCCITCSSINFTYAKP